MEPNSDSLPTNPRQMAETAAAWREKLATSRTHRYLGLFEELLKKFSPLERLALYALVVVLGGSVLFLLAGLNDAVSTEIPATGGTIIEGETAPARFVNPVLALSQPDQDITELVYSGLMRAQPDGTYIPDLAENYTVSPDGTTYTFTIRKNATFQDGTSLTSADILYTVSLAQNPDIKSPRRADWEGVQVSSPDPRTVVFTLPHAYAPFIENTTLGILPKHLWEKVDAASFAFSPLNTHPVGSGPYQVSKVQVDQTGAPTRYDLVPFSNFALGEAHIAHISFIFFAQDDDLNKAYASGEINAIAGPLPSDLASLLKKGGALASQALPRVFGVFLNQSKNPVLADASVRAALDAAMDKEGVVQSVLGGYGVAIDGPVPPGILGDSPPATPKEDPSVVLNASSTPQSFADAAKNILAKGGWKFDDAAGTWSKNKTTLSIKLATADEPELDATAQAVAAAWRAAGVDVSVQIYPLSDFNNTVLRPRNYDAILFGEVVGRNADLFAFWHSSQRNDPGLNLALYTNAKADTLLSEARAETDKRKRDDLYAQFAALVEKDQPAVFLYAPEFLYIVPRELKGVEIGALTTPSERFLNAYEWYTDTEKVWSFFAR